MKELIEISSTDLKSKSVIIPFTKPLYSVYNKHVRKLKKSNAQFIWRNVNNKTNRKGEKKRELLKYIKTYKKKVVKYLLLL